MLQERENQGCNADLHQVRKATGSGQGIYRRVLTLWEATQDPAWVGHCSVTLRQW